MQWSNTSVMVTESGETQEMGQGPSAVWAKLFDSVALTKTAYPS